MKKYAFILLGPAILVLLMAAFSGCGFLSADDFSPGDLPPQWNVNTSGAAYNSFVSFTGSPASDFSGGAAKLIDEVGDVSALGDITTVYVAYSPFYLFIGHESPKSEQHPDANGAFYVMIDNGIYAGDGSNGLTNVSDIGITRAGLTGSFGSFDGAGVGVNRALKPTGKVSFYYKHWRPLGADMKGFGFAKASGAIVQYPGSTFIRFPASSSMSTPVTEVAIPWSYIFGEYTNTAAPPSSIYLWFGTDPTLDRPGPQDSAPDSTIPLDIGTWMQLDIN